MARISLWHESIVGILWDEFNCGFLWHESIVPLPYQPHLGSYLQPASQQPAASQPASQPVIIQFYRSLLSSVLPKDKLVRAGLRRPASGLGERTTPPSAVGRVAVRLREEVAAAAAQVFSSCAW